MLILWPLGCPGEAWDSRDGWIRLDGWEDWKGTEFYTATVGILGGACSRGQDTLLKTIYTLGLGTSLPQQYKRSSPDMFTKSSLKMFSPEQIASR